MTGRGCQVPFAPGGELAAAVFAAAEEGRLFGIPLVQWPIGPASLADVLVQAIVQPQQRVRCKLPDDVRGTVAGMMLCFDVAFVHPPGRPENVSAGGMVLVYYWQSQAYLVAGVALDPPVVTIFSLPPTVEPFTLYLTGRIGG
jgi:hypothetical protein